MSMGPLPFPTEWFNPQPDPEPQGWDEEDEYVPEPGPAEYDEHDVPQPEA